METTKNTVKNFGNFDVCHLFDIDKEKYEKNIVRLKEDRDQMLRSGECTLSDISIINESIRWNNEQLKIIEKYTCC